MEDYRRIKIAERLMELLVEHVDEDKGYTSARLILSVLRSKNTSNESEWDMEDQELLNALESTLEELNLEKQEDE